MSVDLEDYYCDLPFPSWHEYQSRVIKTTSTILDLLDKYKAHATFFTLGYIAERHPGLIEEVKSRGHEIASHGYSHSDIRKMSKDGFESDLVKSLDILRKTAGEQVLGFRAPFFSINKQNLWAFEILRKHVRYDSSVFPVKAHYGLPDAPRYIYRMSDEYPLTADPNGALLELPMTTLRVPLLGNFPVAGGIYLRLLPLHFLKKGIEKFNSQGFHSIVYIHPDDLDPARPRIPEYAWHYYWGLTGAQGKFESLLKNFSFSSAREVLKL